MFKTISPEAAGISSDNVCKFIDTLNKRGLAMHSVLMMKGDNIFAEFYWKPFHKEFCHRMYSQTKSFVGVAIGLLEEEGKLALDDNIVKYFSDKIDNQLPNNLLHLTIKDMLTMQTCGDTPLWFYNEDSDRTHLYFNQNKAKMYSGMRWKYDSPGSQVLSNLVERVSGESLFDYLTKKIFSKLGAFKTAQILKTRNGDSFGDSALLCTTRDIATFARFVMNYGVWNGERIMNENYLKTATSKLVDNRESGFEGIFTSGYGYQIWRYGESGFAFNGLGGQFTVCIPEKDFIFTCTADNQGYDGATDLVLTALNDIIIDNLDKPLAENSNKQNKIENLQNNLKLCFASGKIFSKTSAIISDKRFICDKNSTSIKEFCFSFKDDLTGEFRYTNSQGEKTLPFGIGKNVFTKFPQYGYSNTEAGVITTDGFMYDCAVSGAWTEESKFVLRIQIIDKYFGNLFCSFSFKGNKATVRMIKHAEAFLDEYNGEFTATSDSI